MNCPHCESSLKEVLSKRGILIDVCSTCSGKWLDKGEIHYFYGDKKELLAYEKNGLSDKVLTKHLCPRCQTQMYEGNIFKEKAAVEECPTCKGLWLKEGSFVQLAQMKKIAPNIVIKRPLESLPSLAATSLMVFGGMYAILFAVLVFLSQLEIINYELGLFIALAFAFLQFYFGPWFMDWSLRLIGSLDWIEVDELPLHLQNFIKEICAKHKIPLPKIGLINDGSPQAYTYGRTPKSARLVISKGLIEILDPDELEAVVAHELGHIVHWDFLFMTLAQLVPLLLYHIYRVCSDVAKKKGGNKKGAGAILIAALVAYVAYLITRYLMLFLSRVREYWADRFSVENTRKPDALIGALGKISYGLILKENTDLN